MDDLKKDVEELLRGTVSLAMAGAAHEVDRDEELQALCEAYEDEDEDPADGTMVVVHLVSGRRFLVRVEEIT